MAALLPGGGQQRHARARPLCCAGKLFLFPLLLMLLIDACTKRCQSPGNQHCAFLAYCLNTFVLQLQARLVRNAPPQPLIHANLCRCTTCETS